MFLKKIENKKNNKVIIADFLFYWRISETFFNWKLF